MSDQQQGGAPEVVRVRRNRANGSGDGSRQRSSAGSDTVRLGEEYVPMSPPARGGRRLLAVVAAVLAVVGLGLLGSVLWVTRQIDPPGEQGELVGDVVIEPGTSRDGIGDVLAANGVISSPRVFRAYVQFTGGGPWEAGRYTEFRANSSFDEAVAVLDAGPVPPDARVVRIPEGTNLSGVFRIIEESVPGITAADLLAALGSGAVTSRYKPAEVTNWEGFLFPDTYEFAVDASATDILQTMVDRNDEILDSLDYDRAEALQGRSAYDLITVASLIERETGQPPEERGKIARVIYNRLDTDEILGIDASNLYGLGRTSGELTAADLEVDSPYNLRRNRGLPPTPIAMPGRASLEAAIRAPAGDWLYYVLISNDPPTHLFTASAEEFERAAQESREKGVF